MSTNYLPHEFRVFQELQELRTKIKALEAFFPSDIFKSLSSTEQQLLEFQIIYMRDYARILEQRIKYIDNLVADRELKRRRAFDTLPDDYEAPH
jgi:hypothetical protein